MKWRYLDVSGQSPQKLDNEADVNVSTGNGADSFVQPGSMATLQDLRESAPSLNDTFENANQEIRHTEHTVARNGDYRDHLMNNACSSFNDVFLSNLSNEAAESVIWNLDDDGMDSFIDNSNLNSLLEYPLFKAIDDKVITLSTHYFSNVCVINSCFDSKSNPFRSVIADLMTSSQFVFHLVMMTSASHLCHKEKEMVSVAWQHRQDAISYLINGRNLTGTGTFEAVLGSVLLGMTSAWHDPTALGISHIHTARNLFQQWMSEPEASDDSRSTSFLLGIMAYWEAMVSFITTQDLCALDYLTPLREQEASLASVYPHPWTGVSTTIFIYAAQASTLCRQNRTTKIISTSIKPIDVRESIFNEQYSKASELEAKILEYSPPASDRIRDSDDSFTTVSHFQCLAQIYRFAVLLQLYITFPKLLRKSNMYMSIPGADPSSETVQRLYDQAMVGLAVNILNLISSIPESCGVKVLLTVPLLIAGSSLQKVQIHKEKIENLTIEHEMMSAHCTDFMISHWRTLVRHKLKQLHDFVGLDPILRALRILEAVWLRSDLAMSSTSSSSNPKFVHWLDVMMEERLESIFG
ncbi:hypothetical protein PENSTE_c005G03600 [Penicillium steckii]|uniref:Transcription factor domain-containing protein n=1 Tax=Penicillium steckii TaxID=303698 RepID=A0A1V6TIU3_9EURO|nr:hypothetical protein PENSTE_c005G03600 [Penicillium steckii]